MGGGLEHPVPGPGVEVVAGGGAGVAPERDVLAVGGHRELRRVQPAGMSAEGRFDHGQHAVGGDLHPVAETLEPIHHAVDRRHHAATRRPRPPHSFEQRLGQRHVAVPVGDRTVDEGDVGRERSEEPDGPEGRVGHGERWVRRHRRPLQRPGHDGGQPARGGLEALGEGEDRPVLDSDGTRGVCLLEDRVGRVGGERVARVGRDDLAHHLSPEEQRTERAQAEHHEREAGVGAPMLTCHLARRRGPPAVPAQHLDRVARPDVVGDGVFERHMLHVVA